MINTIIGNYKLSKLIGEGGMASVYEAYHEILGTKVAVKILNPTLSANIQIRERFRNEAKMMGSLNHQNILKVIDFHEEPSKLSIVMEYLDGQDLNQKIQNEGPLSDNDFYRIFSQTLSAFQYAHEQGIVHRDIKPSNIFILKNGDVKILDFGIAKLFGQNTEMTQTGTQIGTPLYMSPEQVKADKSIDYRSDIYSIGVTMYFAINGSPPYDTNTDSQFDIFNKIVYVPLSIFNDKSIFASLVSKATQKEREDRYQTCQEWSIELDNLYSKPDISHYSNSNFENRDRVKSPPPVNKEIKKSNNKKRNTKIALFSLFFLLLSSGIYLSKNYNVIFPKKYEGNYKQWDITFKDVIGINELTDVTERNYFKISHIDENNIKIEEYNQNNNLEETIIVQKKDNHISNISYKNLNGFTYQVRTFEPENDILIEYRKKEGVNAFLPSSYVKHKFQNDLLIETTYYGFDNQRGNGPDGYSIAKFKKYEDDENWGLEKEISYFDINEKPTSSVDDYHKIEFNRDKKGNAIEESYWDKENNPSKNNEGVHCISRIFNEKDQVTQSNYLDQNKQKTKNTYGISKESYQYKNGLLVKLTRFNLADQIYTKTESSSYDGISIIQYSYDEVGNQKAVSYFDENENPVVSNYAYHKEEREFDQHGNEIAYSYFDNQSNRVSNLKGIHKYLLKRNENGLISQINYLDIYLYPTMDPIDQVFIEKFKYNQDGQEISHSFWSTENEKMNRWSEIHEYIKTYNEQGQTAESISMDEFGNLKTETSGGSRKVYEYDNLGRIKKVKVFDNKIPVLVNANAQVSFYHMIEYSYNNLGNIAEIKYFDAEYNPCDVFINLTESVHKVLFEYNGDKVISQKWYLSNQDFPTKNIDCILSDCMSSSGYGLENMND
jgi:serine/threonine protein kinase